MKESIIKNNYIFKSDYLIDLDLDGFEFKDIEELLLNKHLEQYKNAKNINCVFKDFHILKSNDLLKNCYYILYAIYNDGFEDRLYLIGNIIPLKENVSFEIINSEGSENLIYPNDRILYEDVFISIEEREKQLSEKYGDVNLSLEDFKAEAILNYVFGENKGTTII